MAGTSEYPCCCKTGGPRLGMISRDGFLLCSPNMRDEETVRNCTPPAIWASYGNWYSCVINPDRRFNACTCVAGLQRSARQDVTQICLSFFTAHACGTTSCGGGSFFLAVICLLVVVGGPMAKKGARINRSVRVAVHEHVGTHVLPRATTWMHGVWFNIRFRRRTDV